MNYRRKITRKHFAAALFACLLFTNVTRAQIKYDVTEDDPYDIKPFSVHVDPFYVDGHVSDITIGFGLRADALLFKKIEARLDFRKAYLDINARGNSANNTLPEAKNGLKKHTFFEAGGTLFLSDRTRKRNLKITLSRSSSGNYTYERYFMAPGTKRKMFGVRGGVYFLSTAITPEGDGEARFTMVNNANRDQKVKIGGYGTSVDGSDIYEASTMMRTATVYAGLHFKSVTNFSVNVTDWGGRTHSGYLDYFVDVLFAPVVSLQDVKTAGGQTWTLEPDNGVIKRLGWRAGMSFRKPSSTWLSYKAEIGSRPGYQTSVKGLDNEKAFLMLTMGINIPFKGTKIENKLRKKE